MNTAFPTAVEIIKSAENRSDLCCHLKPPPLTSLIIRHCLAFLFYQTTTNPKFPTTSDNYLYVFRNTLLTRGRKQGSSMLWDMVNVNSNKSGEQLFQDGCSLLTTVAKKCDVDIVANRK